MKVFKKMLLVLPAMLLALCFCLTGCAATTDFSGEYTVIASAPTDEGATLSGNKITMEIAKSKKGLESSVTYTVSGGKTVVTKGNAVQWNSAGKFVQGNGLIFVTTDASEFGEEEKMHILYVSPNIVYIDHLVDNDKNMCSKGVVLVKKFVIRSAREPPITRKCASLFSAPRKKHP